MHIIEDPRVSGTLAIANAFQLYLWKICNASTFHRRSGVYWWTPELKPLRTECIIVKKAYQWAGRRAGAVDRNEERAAYVSRKSLTTTIKSSQEKAWREVFDAVNSDP